MILYSEKTKMRKPILSTTFAFFLASIWFPTINFCLKGVVKNYVYSCKSLQNITWLFLYSLLQHFDFFSIFLLPMTISTFLKRFSRLKQTKTEQKYPKDCSVWRNSKLFGSLQLLVISEHPWEPLIPYIGFILRTIYT